MFQKSFTKFALLGLMSLVIGATGVFAQGSSCGLKIDVKRDDNDAAVSGATAIAVNAETKKVFRSVLRRGMPLFVNLNDGEYLITVTKLGYKKSAYTYIVKCAEMEDGMITTSVPMWQGSSKQTVSANGKNEMEFSVGRYDPNQKVYTDSPNDGDGAPITSNSPRTISGGVINGKATNLVKPEYPAAARAVQASGAVNVQVTIDEQGNVISAQAVSGHPLLRSAAVKAARASKFAQTRLSGQLVKVTGIIVYNFVP